MILEAESQLHRSGPRYLLTFSCKDFQPMDSATKPVKPSSNISDIVYRFAKVCRLKSIGVFPGETPNHHHGNNGPATEDSSDATEEAEYDFQKIHPQPIEETLGRPPQDSVLTVIPKLFDTISALKLAYIHLQEAHIPYDPEKIRAADDLVVCKLKALSDIKRSYKEKKSQVEAQDSVILQLQQELETSDRKNADLSEKLKQKAFQEENARKVS
uniref:DUF641 domain-containing protein n=1 Tax=Nelumbo nucifera TaxID=4432 RepID=A0A822Y3F4_NELNU|nr:TPA_asm: hypothetical protein HUJ06_027287 [Nelumbo nucifera]